ncbi:C40 family peptidase [Heyndrickxia camelliae]|uniref:Peptidase P60 n=1 Tax=Heyndrickxia camelliae TaxID=1707093 RepID=A0A2N3LK68_9BACI|nr:C40 family peptidase [Heyndrickxia camelliae]PKR84954.1 peptidase P60 [Heyndrickxia camelliae]
MKRIAPFLLTLLLGIVFLLPAKEAAAASSPKVITVAKKYIGTPYRYGGITPKGFDCSGFVSYSYKKAGVALPHSAAAMFKKGKSVKKSKLKPGDLVFFNTGSKKVSHVAIYIGNNKVIHSVSKGVKIDCLSNPYWKTRYIGAKRV